jgi:hypothetical protein
VDFAPITASTGAWLPFDRDNHNFTIGYGAIGGINLTDNYRLE